MRVVRFLIMEPVRVVVVEGVLRWEEERDWERGGGGKEMAAAGARVCTGVHGRQRVYAPSL